MQPGIKHYCSFIGQATGSQPPIQTPSNLMSCYGAFKKHENLSRDQKTLLRLHHRFGHRPMADIQAWAREGLFDIPIEVTKVPFDKLPVCLACACGANRRKSHKQNQKEIGKQAKLPGDFL